MSSNCVTNLSPAGFSSYVDDLGGLGTYCSAANPQSVRFFHKFDPVPSQAMWKGQFAHGVEHAMMLWDAPTASCTDITGCAISAISLTSTGEDSDYGLDGTDPNNIVDYLCDKWGVEPKAMYTSCYDEITSYMSVMNPWPCGEITFHRMSKEEFTTAELQTISQDGVQELYHNDEMVGALDLVQLSETMFLAFEDYVDCVETWESTFATYVGFFIADVPVAAPIAPLLFTFAWVHSTYPNYPLCTEVKSDGTIEATNVDAEDIDSVMTNECSASELNACSADCSSSKSKKEDEWCFWDCSEACYYEATSAPTRR
jgi:hypothetical protein